jgi:hypothetical protein
MAVFECSKVLDQQIRDDQVDTSEVEKFDTLMQETILYIKELSLGSVPPSTFSPLDSDGDLAEKTAFIKRLERNEFIDDDTLFAYINALPFNETEKQTLTTLVEELQYSKAIEMINSAG